MATKQEIDAAFAALKYALREEPPSWRERLAAAWQALRFTPAPGRMLSEVRQELLTVAGYLIRPGSETAGVRAELDSLAARCGYALHDHDDWDEDGVIAFDETELEEARRRARCGQIDDCLHHLERALPEGYGVIAERITVAIRRTS